MVLDKENHLKKVFESNVWAATVDSALTKVPALLCCVCWALKVGFLVPPPLLCPSFVLVQLMDWLSFYVLLSQISMNAQKSPVWTLVLAKIWLADITAAVFGDGSAKTVTSVSIPSLNVISKFLSFHRCPLPLAVSKCLLSPPGHTTSV